MNKKINRVVTISLIALCMSLGLSLISYFFLKKLVVLFHNNEFYLRMTIFCVWVISWPSFTNMLNAVKEESPPEYRSFLKK